MVESEATTTTRTIVVVGNPKRASRTRDAGVRLVAALGLPEPEVIELADLGPGLLGWGDPEVKAAVTAVQAADVVVFASPTYKATYTGLLKLFLDLFAGGTGLEGVVAVPLLLGAAPNHALAAELTLRPVLSEIGGITATPGLYQLDSNYADDPALGPWAERWGAVVRAIVDARLPRSR